VPICASRGFQGACRNILEHRDALWRFVSDSNVEPTNNHAERELRGLVCWRRCSGGTQSERGTSSLRRAQLALRNDPRYKHPYYWGAFSLFGWDK